MPFKVTGVLKNFPANSSISFNFVASEPTILKDEENKSFFAGDWSSGAFSTYFLLNRSASISDLNKKLDQLINANIKEQTGVTRSTQLQAITDVHFYSGDIEGYSGAKGNITYIYVLVIVACFIIFLACINYMNLSTARFSSRAKEIAVRKVAGASRKSIANQFLVEAVIVAFISIILSILIVNLLLPAFNNFSGKDLSLGSRTDYRIWLGIAIVLVLVSLLAGLYPAIFQAGLNPLSLLKSKIRVGTGIGKHLLFSSLACRLC